MSVSPSCIALIALDCAFRPCKNVRVTACACNVTNEIIEASIVPTKREKKTAQ